MNPTHREIFDRGPEFFNDWRLANPEVTPDFEGARFARLQIKGYDLKNCNFEICFFFDCDITNTVFSSSNLRNVQLDSVRISKSKFYGAMLEDAIINTSRISDCVLSGATIRKCRFVEAAFQDNSLAGLQIIESEALECTFSEDKTRNCIFDSFTISNSVFNSSKTETNVFEKVNINNCNFKGCKFSEDEIVLVSFRGVFGLASCGGLESLALRTKDSLRYFDDTARRWSEVYCDWEQLRRFGNLPLFGLSYSALIVIPASIWVLAWYNEKVELIKKWAVTFRIKVKPLPGEFLDHFATYIYEHARLQPIPSLSFLLFLSTILLAIASTIYVIFCPSRIQHYTKDEWCDGLGKSLLHYWPISWKFRKLRLICGACYLIGGSLALFVIAVKVLKAGWFIWRHSTFGL